jgi:hypothetical protein
VKKLKCFWRDSIEEKLQGTANAITMTEDVLQLFRLEDLAGEVQELLFEERRPSRTVPVRERPGKWLIRKWLSKAHAGQNSSPVAVMIVSPPIMPVVFVQGKWKLITSRELTERRDMRVERVTSCTRENLVRFY